MNNIIHIAMAANDNYAPFLGVVILSIVENLPEDAEVNFHIIEDGISEENLDKIKSMTSNKCEISIYKCPVLDDIEIPASEMFPKIVYGRLFLASLLDPKIKRILYLDIDIVIRGDVTPLYNFDLKGKCCGAIEENRSGNLSRLTLLGIPKDYAYFNSGVMLIDLDIFREKHYQDKCFDFVNNNRDILWFFDQDTLNSVLVNDVTFLPHKYNAMTLVWNNEYNQDGTFIYPDLRLGTPKDIVIVHFNQRPKPWNYICTHPYANLFVSYIHKSRWNNYTLTDKNIVTITKKIIKRIFKMNWKYKKNSQ